MSMLPSSSSMAPFGEIVKPVHGAVDLVLRPVQRLGRHELFAQLLGVVLQVIVNFLDLRHLKFAELEVQADAVGDMDGHRMARGVKGGEHNHTLLAAPYGADDSEV